MPHLHLFVCFCLSLNLISPNGKPQARAQSTQCVGEQVIATCMGRVLEAIHTLSQCQFTFCTKTREEEGVAYSTV